MVHHMIQAFHSWVYRLKKGKISTQRLAHQDFPGSPVVNTPSFQCTGSRFDPWSGD